MSKFTEWSKQTGVPVWAFFAAVAVVVVLAVKLLLL